MSFELQDLLKPAVGLYIAGVVGGQILVAYLHQRREKEIQERREKAGLNQQVLVDHATRLKDLRQQTLIESSVLLGSVIILPFLLAEVFGDNSKGLSVAFLAMIVWVLFSASDVGKAFISGIAFRAFASLRRPFQVGDRVTLGGHSGKVEYIGPFYVRLITSDDDLVSIPTASLWDSTLVSANAGDKASLCVMSFYLAPFVSADARKKTEDAIWNAIQKSLYWDFGKPMQIYVEQNRDEIVLTAKSYVASTYNELLFKSDVYQSFLDFTAKNNVPLASTEWRREVGQGN